MSEPACLVARSGETMPRTLLLADDSVVIQKLVGLSFANEDIEIITVDNGDDAVARAIEIKPSLVLADVVMPGKNGYEVCEAIKQHPELSGIPVLLLTGTFEAFDETRAQQVGADGQVTKPFEAQALVERVGEILTNLPAPGDAPAPAPGSDFFDSNLGDLANASESPGDSFSFGTGDSESSTSERMVSFGDLEGDGQPLSAPLAANGSAIIEEPAASPTGTPGDDLTIAMMPEDNSNFSADPAAATLFDDVAPIATPDATLLADDLLADPAIAADPAETILADESFGGQSTAPIGEPPPLDIGESPAVESAAPTEPIAQPAGAGAGALDFEELSFASTPAAVENPAPPLDETVLGGDLFNEPNAAARPEPVVEATPAMTPSNGLDLNFGTAGSTPAASESVTPSNVDPYDVSSSELDLNPFPASPEWNEPASEEPAVESAASREMEQAKDSSSAAILETPGDGFVTAAPVEKSPIDDSTPQQPVAASGAPSPDITPMMRDRIQDTLEKVAWEAFSDLSDTMVRQLVERVEKIAWEVIPQMAETLIQDEIRRMKDENE